jgi:hypothetical protein
MGTNIDVGERWRLYKEALVQRFWSFQKPLYLEKDSFFEKTYVDNPKRPPVFLREYGYENVLVNENLGKESINQVRNIIPNREWHIRFASMTSSQALAQSVFGNIKVLRKLGCLSGLLGDDGNPLFITGKVAEDSLEMEKSILYLGETSRKTKIDVFIGGAHQVAVECKLTEPEVGPCSRPKLRRDAPNYYDEFCDGRYVRQLNRNERCSLTHIGLKYWELIPSFFNWDCRVDNDPCPLNRTYQLARNVLAACMRPKSGSEDEAVATDGHAVLLYDKRNPQFQEGGDGWQAFLEVKEGLRDSSLLQSCTWQEVISAMAGDKELAWLVAGLLEKYGLEAGTS